MTCAYLYPPPCSLLLLPGSLSTLYRRPSMNISALITQPSGMNEVSAVPCKRKADQAKAAAPKKQKKSAKKGDKTNLG